MSREQALELVVERVKGLKPQAHVLSRRLDGYAHEVEIRGDDADSFLVVISSSVETVIKAGVRARYELDPLPDGLDQCVAIISAVLEGHLWERAGPRTSKFQLQLADGSALKGRVSDAWFHPSLRATRDIRPPFSTSSGSHGARPE
jgi:hypothetical protein